MILDFIRGWFSFMAFLSLNTIVCLKYSTFLEVDDSEAFLLISILWFHFVIHISCLLWDCFLCDMQKRPEFYFSGYLS